MTVRRPKPDSAARILVRALSELGLSIKYTQAQELFAKVQGFQNAHAMRVHAKAQKDKFLFDVTCPVLAPGAKPIAVAQLKDMESREDIRVVVEFEGHLFLDNLDLDTFLDMASERITGSLCGLSDISYRIVHLPYPTQDCVAFEIVACEINWETIDRPAAGSPRRTLKAIEFAGQGFNEVLSVDFDEDLFSWLEGDRSATEDDGDFEVIQYEYDGTRGVNYLTLEDLVNATIAADGKLTMEDGTELYLIDQNRERWAPKALEGRVNDKMQELSSSLKAMEPKSTDLSGINYFVQSFRTHPSALTARTLRKVAGEYLEEALIQRADYEAYFKETDSIIAEWRKTADGQPNPALPFYGCELPKEITFIEEVSSDARALEWSKKREVNFVDERMLDWLEGGLKEDESEGRELSDELLEYEDVAHNRSISGLDLIEAQLKKDGRFELNDGTEFYLIDGAGMRWFPKDRVR